mgnify:CR=1 FL=1
MNNTVFQDEKKYHIWLFASVLAASIFVYAANVTVFMDDVFIYLRVAKNIVNGIGPVFNSGDTHFPITSPLWVMLLALFSKVFTSIDSVALSKILFIVFLSSASWFSFLLFRKYIGVFAALVPLPIFFNYISTSCSGGEIALVYFAMFGLLWAYLKKKSAILTGIFGAIGYLARGELVLLLCMVVLHFLFLSLKNKDSYRKIFRFILIISGTFFVCIMFWHLYYFIFFGSLFPNTLKAKIVQGKSGLWGLYKSFGRSQFDMVLKTKIVLIVFFLFGVFYFRTLSFFLTGFTIIHYYVYSFMVIPFYHWYYYDYHLILNLFTFLGFAALAHLLMKKILIHLKKYSWKKSVTIPLLIIFTFISLFIIYYTSELKDISRYKSDKRYNDYVKLANWIRPKLKKDDVILSGEIGILGYELQDHVFRDTNGIASPNISLKNINKIGSFVADYSPRYMIFPREKDSTRIELNKTDVFFFKRIYMSGKSREDYGTVYERDYSDIPRYLKNLLGFLRSPEILFEASVKQMGGKYILFVHAPFSSTVDIPPSASGFEISYGILKSAWKTKSKHMDGSLFRLIGHKKGSVGIVFMEKLVDPSKGNLKDNYNNFKISFAPGTFEKLEVQINERQNNYVDWTYLGNFCFFMDKEQ